MYQYRNMTGDTKTERAFICMTNTLAQSYKGRKHYFIVVVSPSWSQQNKKGNIKSDWLKFFCFSIFTSFLDSKLFFFLQCIWHKGPNSELVFFLQLKTLPDSVVIVKTVTSKHSFNVAVHFPILNFLYIFNLNRQSLMLTQFRQLRKLVLRWWSLRFANNVTSWRRNFSILFHYI